MTQQKTCDYCHRTFDRPRGWANSTWNAKRFCNRSCSQKAKYDLIPRFEANFSPEPNTGCWIWTGGSDPAGYGRVTLRKKQWLAHRLSYVIHCGEIPDGMKILHSCDNPWCVNPDHLSPGTQAENIQQMVERNRVSHGQAHCHARLTEAQALEIRASSDPVRLLAERYGVGETAIRKIKQNVHWRRAA